MAAPVKQEEENGDKKEGVIAKRKIEQLACELVQQPLYICFSAALTLKYLDNASNFTTGRAAASFTSTTLIPETKSERAMFDEEECKAVLLHLSTADWL